MSRGRGSATGKSPMMRRRGPGRHDHDPVGERDRLLEVVRDEHHRLAVGGPEVEQEVAHDLPGLRVERPERLVHEQDLGVADQHLRQRDALALAAGEHVRVAVDEGRRARPGASHPRARSAASPRGTPFGSSATATLSSAVFHGISASCWKR